MSEIERYLWLVVVWDDPFTSKIALKNPTKGLRIQAYKAHAEAEAAAEVVKESGRSVELVKVPLYQYGSTRFRPIGPHEVDAVYCEGVPDYIERVTYWYKDCGYDGSGIALLEKTDKSGRKKAIYYMDHCSCYGPFDNLKNEELLWVEPKEAEKLYITRVKEARGNITKEDL